MSGSGREMVGEQGRELDVRFILESVLWVGSDRDRDKLRYILV